MVVYPWVLVIVLTVDGGAVTMNIPATTFEQCHDSIPQRLAWVMEKHEQSFRGLAVENLEIKCEKASE